MLGECRGNCIVGRGVDVLAWQGLNRGAQGGTELNPTALQHVHINWI